MKNNKTTTAIWESAHFFICERSKVFRSKDAIHVARQDGAKYFLCRKSSGAVIDEFGDFQFAVAVAEYCERHGGGSYMSDIRNAAKTYAREVGRTGAK